MNQPIVTTLRNHRTELIDGFLTGDNLVATLSANVFETFHSGTGGDYTTHLGQARAVMANSKSQIVADVIFHVDHPGTQVTHATKVAMVRSINLAHKGRYFVVLGNEIIYTPAHYRGVTEENLKLYVALNMEEENRRKGKSLFKSIRGALYRARLHLTMSAI